MDFGGGGEKWLEKMDGKKWEDKEPHHSREEAKRETFCLWTRNIHGRSMLLLKALGVGFVVFLFGGATVFGCGEV